MKKLLLLATLLLLPVFALSQTTGGNCNAGVTPQCRDTQTITVSGHQIKISNNGGLVAGFEEIINGSPVSVSVVISGCQAGGTCDTLDTYTTVANAIRSPTISKAYSYFLVKATWSGGSNVSVQVNTSITTANNASTGAAVDNTARAAAASAQTTANSALSKAAAASSTIGTVLRSAVASATTNITNQPPLIPSPAWVASTAYGVGNVVVNGGNLYLCAVAGTSAASGGPTGTAAAAVTDGTVSWFYYGVPQITTASPLAPTVTITNSVLSGLTNWFPSVASDHVTIEPQFGYLGGIPQVVHNAGTGAYQVQISANSVSGTPNLTSPGGYTFSTDAPKISIFAHPTNAEGSVQITVDGQLLSPNAISQLTLNSSDNYLNLDFSLVGRKVRTITLWNSNGQITFYGVYVDPYSNVWAPAPPNITACVMGDSFTAGGGSGAYFEPINALDQWPMVAGQKLGIVNVWNMAIGGTGWLAGSPNNVSGFLANTTNSGFLSGYCNLIIINMGINDSGVYTGAQITAAVTADLQTLRSLNASAPIIVTGTWYATDLTTEQAIQAGVTAEADPNVYFLPMATDPTNSWLTGSGNITAPVSGPLSVCLGNASHPTAVCEKNWMGPKMANAIKAIIPSIQ